MRVCPIIHDLRRGGAEHLLVDLARVAPAAGLDIEVVGLMPVEGHGYGTVIRPADPAALTAAVAELAADPARRERMGKAARESSWRTSR